MIVGENPNKVSNIVTPLIGEFDKIYSPLIEPLKPYVIVSS